MCQPAQLVFREKMKSLAIVVCSGSLAFCGINLYLGNEKFYRDFVMPAVHHLDPETAHSLAIKMTRHGIFPKPRYTDPPILKTSLWDLDFKNPLGIAAGFDKHAEAVEGLHKMGFGFIEVGSVTPEPQEGNPKPRIFKLTEDRAVINRCGFNSVGHEQVFKRLCSTKSKSDFKGVVGVNLGKNKTSSDYLNDYVKGIQKFGEIAHYLVINVSSPNTPGLRNLQGRQNLELLINKAVEARDSLPGNRKPPILIKIAPDLSDEEKADIAALLITEKKIDGLIVSNTTISRPLSLESDFKTEDGGLSGKPLRDLATATIRDMFRLTKGEIPIIGVGGIGSGADAYEKIRAGASLVQLYSAFVYDGPPIIIKIKRELQALLERDGFDSVQDAVGSEQSISIKSKKL